MNRYECDVVVVGAGPAGAATAYALASHGRDVLLLDRHAFPRDKVCGDALIPDGLRALERLGLAAEVRSQARLLRGIDVYAPNGSCVRVAGDVACLSRRKLDDTLRRAAVRAGARFLAPYDFTNLARAGKVTTVRAVTRDRAGIVVAAPFVVIATGANSRSLQAAGVCRRERPSAVAARAYYHNAALAASLDTLLISFEQAILPGYGWIFPEPDGLLNIGTAMFLADGQGMRGINLRNMFTRFSAGCTVARQVIGASVQVTPLKGAPLRTGLTGALLGIPGVLVVGEAAGATYSFTGEGIGKALETGLIAAETLEDFFTGVLAYNGVHEQYQATIERRLRARYRSYSIAQRWCRHPRLGNWVADRARKQPHVLRRLEGILGESEHPTKVFSLLGMGRALVART